MFGELREMVNRNEPEVQGIAILLSSIESDLERIKAIDYAEGILGPLVATIVDGEWVYGEDRWRLVSPAQEVTFDYSRSSNSGHSVIWDCVTKLRLEIFSEHGEPFPTLSHVPCSVFGDLWIQTTPRDVVLSPGGQLHVFHMKPIGKWRPA